MPPHGKRPFQFGGTSLSILYNVVLQVSNWHFPPWLGAVSMASVIAGIGFDIWRSNIRDKFRGPLIAVIAFLGTALTVHFTRDRIARDRADSEAAATSAQMADDLRELARRSAREVPAILPSIPIGEVAKAEPDPVKRPAIHRRPLIKSSTPEGEIRGSPESAGNDPVAATVEGTGTIRIHAVDPHHKPLAATCIVSGVSVFAPYESSIRVGEVPVTCRLEDYDDGFAVAKIAEGQRTDLTVVLQSKLGGLTVMVRDSVDNPINGKCSLDGGQELQVSGGPAGWMRLLLGKHRLKCTSPGYETIDQDVTIVDGFVTATARLRKQN